MTKTIQGYSSVLASEFQSEQADLLSKLAAYNSASNALNSVIKDSNLYSDQDARELAIQNAEIDKLVAQQEYFEAKISLIDAITNAISPVNFLSVP